MSNLKNEEFHVPFIRNLAFIGLVTVVSMITTHFLVINYLPNLIKTHIYTVQQSQINPK
jgi:isoprenylcysteine carboxyl methyltransferase (ICMT) family protein YpbQ